MNHESKSQKFTFQRHSFLFKVCLVLLVILMFSSCVLYPRYRRPCTEMPEHWRFASDETSTVVNRRWWEQFHDPVLNELIQEALDNNKDLGLATARIAEFRARFGITRSQLFPQVSAQASLSRQRISETTANNFFPIDVNNGNYAGGNYNQAANLLSDIPFTPYFNDDLATFNVSYELDLWGKNRSATSAAFAELLSQVDAQRAVILSVVSSVALAYIRLRQYDRQLQISIQTLESRQKSLELANIRFQEGLTSELEVKQAASEREEAAIQMIQFQTLIPQQEDLLSVLIGHPPKAIQRGQSVDGWQLPPQVPAGLPADLLEQRPDIQQAEKQLIAANFRIGEARALYFPDITLTGYYGYESSELDRLFTDPSRTWQWMLSLLQPLFTGGRISNTVDLAQALKREAAYQYLQTTLTALQEVNDALVAHRDSKRSLLVDEERVRDLAEYLRLARLQYDNGLVDYLNVLDAERRLFNAELDLARDKANVFITLVNIYRALGGGWVVDAENLMQGECPFQEELKSTEKDS